MAHPPAQTSVCVRTGASVAGLSKSANAGRLTLFEILFVELFPVNGFRFGLVLGCARAISHRQYHGRGQSKPGPTTSFASIDFTAYFRKTLEMSRRQQFRVTSRCCPRYRGFPSCRDSASSFRLRSSRGRPRPAPPFVQDECTSALWPGPVPLSRHR